MPQFNIRYTEAVPPAVGPSVPAHLDVQTGAGEMWSQIARAGGQLAELGEKILQGQQLIKRSRIKSQIDTAFDTALLTAQTTGDPQARFALYQEAEQKARVAPGDDPQMLAYLEGRSADFQRSYLGFEVERQTKETVDAAKHEYEKVLEAGDEVHARVLITGLERINAITHADAEAKRENLPVVIPLHQAKKAVELGNLPQAQLFIEEAKKHDPTAEQLEYANVLSGEIQKMGKELEDNFEESLCDDFTKMAKTTSVEDRRTAYETIKEKIDQNLFSAKAKIKWQKMALSQFRGEGEIDYNATLNIRDRIDRVATYGVQDPTLRPDITEGFATGIYGFGPMAEKRYRDDLRRLERVEVDEKWKVTELTRRNFRSYVEGYDPEDVASAKIFMYEEDLRKQLDVHKEWTPGEARIRAEEMAPLYREIGKETALEMARVRAQRARVRFEETQKLPTIMTDEEYDALPSGQFKDAQGRIWQKP